IPALFASGTVPPAAPAVVEEPVAEPEKEPPPAEAPVSSPDPICFAPALDTPNDAAPLNPAPPVEAPGREAIPNPADSPPAAEAATGPAAHPLKIAVEPAAIPAVPDAVPAAVERTALPVPRAADAAFKSVGEVFGQPDKSTWSPSEIVQQLGKRPDVAGAIVALKEGLVVAHELPEGMRGEVFAAFLPQIFARLNQYAGEMKLGEVDDLVLSTNGAHFQIFRLGILYFAVLGKPGETLPWQELRVIADFLAGEPNH
ncbi:MAG: roadblock/LC7 domain-containing protein, partial [Verrucomicrobiota bacterium]|nr:roadblock/LC7 domain-containing protein [Verrucomicrobiota bacterium]